MVFHQLAETSGRMFTARASIALEGLQHHAMLLTSAVLHLHCIGTGGIRCCEAPPQGGTPLYYKISRTSHSSGRSQPF